MLEGGGFWANQVKLCMVDQLFLRRLTHWPEDILLSGSVLEVRGWLDFAFLSEYITHVALVFFAGDFPKTSPCWAPRWVGSMGDESSAVVP